MSTPEEWEFVRVYNETKTATFQKNQMRILSSVGLLMRDGKRVTSQVLQECLMHRWQLTEEKHRFTLECPKCRTKIKIWKNLPINLMHVLSAIARLEHGENSESMVRMTADSLDLPTRKRYDIAITLLKLLRVKAGGACGDELIGCKTLRKLVHLCAWPSDLNKMPRSTMRPFQLVIQAITLTNVRLERSLPSSKSL